MGGLRVDCGGEGSGVGQAKRMDTRNGLGATLYAKFAKDAVDVSFDRTCANDQAGRDLVIGETGDNQLQDL